MKMNGLKVVKKYLESKGGNVIKFNEMKTDRGHDLEAMYGNDRLILECKGFPSDYYVSRPRNGEPKPANSKLQAHHWFADVLYSVLKAKSKDPNVRIGIALPSVKGVYEKFIQEIQLVNKNFNIIYYLVGSDKSVSESAFF